MSENKALIIKSPSSIDADLMKVNEIRFNVESEANGNHTIVEPNTLNVKVLDNTNLSIVENTVANGFSLANNANTAQKGTISVMPASEITRIGNLVTAINHSNVTLMKVFFAEGLEAIADLTNIYYLDLANTSVSGDIANLKNLTKLAYLNLANTSMSGDIANLKNLTKLAYLNLANTSMSGDIANLKNLTKLTYIEFPNISVSGDITNLKNLTKLTYLNLANTSVSGDIANLKNLTKLTSLWCPIAVDASADKAKAVWIAMYENNNNHETIYWSVGIDTGLYGTAKDPRYNVSFSANKITVQGAQTEKGKTFLIGTKGSNGNWTWVES